MYCFVINPYITQATHLIRTRRPFSVFCPYPPDPPGDGLSYDILAIILV